MLDEVLEVVDYVLVMSVNPGFGGQRFIPNSLEKVASSRAGKGTVGLHFPIEIDGGVTLENVAEVCRPAWSGWSRGRPIFHSVNPGAAFEEMRRARRAHAVAIRV